MMRLRRAARSIPLWGLFASVQGRTQELGRDIDDGDYTFVGHAGRPNDAEHPNHLVVDYVWRGHEADIVQDPATGFLADEDLHAIRPQPAIQEPQDVVLLIKGLEQAPQAIDVGQSGEPHDIG